MDAAGNVPSTGKSSNSSSSPSAAALGSLFSTGALGFSSAGLSVAMLGGLCMMKEEEEEAD